MKQFFVLIPRSISSGVLESQIIDRFGRSANYVSFKPNNKVIEDSNITLKNVCEIQRGDELYIRSAFEFCYFYVLFNVFRLKRVRVIFDFRGIISEESFLRNQSYTRWLILNFFEALAFYCADEIWTVSSRLKKYLSSKYRIRKKITYFPCATKSSLVRKRLLDDSIDQYVFVYIGSISVWQCFKEACLIYKSLECNATKFVVYTRDVEQAREIIAGVDINNVEISSLDRNDVLPALDSAHFGFVLRENNVVNCTASPIKFCEYIARGVIPIMTEYVGDYSGLAGGLAEVVSLETQNLNFNQLKQRVSQETYEGLFDLARGLSEQSILASRYCS